MARDTWLYELKESRKTVYIGISNDPDRRLAEHERSGKKFTHMNITSVALTRESAEQREAEKIQKYQRQHGGAPPKHNHKKTY